MQFPKRCVILRFIEYRAMGRVQKPSNLERYTPSSEPFRIYRKLSSVFRFCLLTVIRGIYIYYKCAPNNRILNNTMY
jgi:hypothetical protein